MPSVNQFSGSPTEWPGPQISCVCGARAGYRIWRKGESSNRAFHRCPACANGYPASKFEHEALPHVAQAFEELIYASYKAQRLQFPHVTPERWAASFRENFAPRIEQLEARFQAEQEQQRRAS